MIHPRCPISNSTNVKVLEKISVKDIAALYGSTYPIESIPSFKAVDFIFKYESLNTHYKFYYPFSLQGGEGLYRSLEQFDWYYMKEKWEYDESIKFISPTDRVLEIGCGDGNFLDIVNNKFNSNPVGLELNQTAIDKARSRGLTVFNELLNNFS